MNEATLTQLKILVERAVRPVRGSTSLKRKVREELLAHVTAVFEDEAGRTDEPAALARTNQRFGQPAELTAQIQDAVPTSDALDRFVEQVLAPPGETMPRRALRHASLIGLFVLAVFACAGISAWSWEALLYGGSVALSFFLMVFEFYVLAEWMRHAQCGPAGFSLLETVRVALIAGLVFPLSLYFPFVLFEPEVQFDNVLLLAGLFGVTMTALLSVFARAADIQLRTLQDWASLDIDGKNGAPA